MDNEPSLDDVYRKFGEVAEAGQLLETGLGNLLLLHRAIEAGLLEDKDPEKAAQILEHINRSTLGQLLWQLHGSHDGLDELDELLTTAKLERNRLNHAFYRQYNFRRNSAEGRLLMLKDLKYMHEKIIKAYKAVMKLSGVDLDNIQLAGAPVGPRADIKLLPNNGFQVTSALTPEPEC